MFESRREFLQELLFAASALGVNPLRDVLTTGDEYRNGRLRLVLRRPLGWEFRSIADFAALREKQVVLELVGAGTHPLKDPNNLPVFLFEKPGRARRPVCADLVAAGVTLLSLAGASIGWRTYRAEFTRWVPVDVPFPATATSIPARAFTIDREGSYEIVVKIRRPPLGPERVRAECLLGFDPGNPQWGTSAAELPCIEAPVVDLTWHLTSDGGPVVDVNGDSMGAGRASGIANAGGFAGDEVDRWLGSFVAKRGLQYVLTMETHVDAAALATFAPRLVVQSSPSINRDEAVTTAIVWLVAALAGSAGVVALVLGAVHSRRSTGHGSAA